MNLDPTDERDFLNELIRFYDFNLTLNFWNSMFKANKTIQKIISFLIPKLMRDFLKLLENIYNRLILLFVYFIYRQKIKKKILYND